jgi:hypothetical protein
MRSPNRAHDLNNAEHYNFQRYKHHDETRKEMYFCEHCVLLLSWGFVHEGGINISIDVSSIAVLASTKSFLDGNAL